MKKKNRLTLDMKAEDHMYLKMASAKLGVSMREFVLSAMLQKIEDLEDEWLLQNALKTWNDIESGDEETISWNEIKKRLY